MDLSDILFSLYPYAKSLHIMAVLSWMAGLFYLPRLYVYHVEQAQKVQHSIPIFLMMEDKLLRLIMRPAMIVTWGAGLLMVFTPGVVDWSDIWPWTKGASVIAMTGFHQLLQARYRDLAAGQNTLTGRQYRLLNEIPTLLMVIIVVSVVFKF
ncbi:CopD family protein [Parasedimentitalea psychrophila]|uniref:Protoporphyrinogen IX oxidase n=1 Tax=Parasedimentitalea psychrophila TaxID=2997337 RepID=A0A9Y2L3B7_9RHOB|nr:CopD family protein [Parasedimentitalea psychrophila]WIY26817.1 CopD family protein [Parasedimentitalea psychrophila]